MNYTLALSSQQLQFLLETVQAFVGNKKLIHLPDQAGEIIALPLTEEALVYILSKFEELGLEGRQEITVVVEKASDQDSDQLAKVRVEIDGSELDYDVNLEEFDPQ